MKDKLINMIGWVMDAVFCLFLTYKLFVNFIAGDDIMGVMFTIALALWCISHSLATLILNNDSAERRFNNKEKKTR